MRASFRKPSLLAVSILVISGLLLQSGISYSSPGVKSHSQHTSALPSPVETTLATPSGTVTPPAAQANEIMQHLQDASLRFVPNVGQFDPSVLYAADGGGFSFYLTQQEAVLSIVATPDITQPTQTTTPQPTFTPQYPTFTWTPTRTSTPSSPSSTPASQTPVATTSPQSASPTSTLQLPNQTTTPQPKADDSASTKRLSDPNFPLGAKGRNPLIAEPTSTPAPTATLHLSLRGANASPIVTGTHELATKTNYFYGNDAS